MKRILQLSFLLLIISGLSCRNEKPIAKVIDGSLTFSVNQYKLLAESMKGLTDQLPRSLDEKGKLITAESHWWTSGFFPGSLWYLYEYSKDTSLKSEAEAETMKIENEKFTKTSHDLGFMLYCSFGNGLRITGDEKDNEVLLTGARSLSTRFRANIGCIQSWGSSAKWQCPVIIDNMMNLELLMWAFKNTGDSSFYRIAVSHADTTMKYHFRKDFSSFHVVSYDTTTGKVQARQTAQGFSDSSAWARGQSWGLYGYIMMYRETHLGRYLNQAQHIADFLINNQNMPEDKIPYWDYDAPGIPNATRDASAGSVMASALIELSGYVPEKEGKKYLKVAERQIRSLASPVYMAESGRNGNFILMHSVGSIPANSEVDVPLTYADYYFIEAMMRYRALLLKSR